MTLVIVHYHLRPGGIRRIIELATPHLLRGSPRRITRVVLLTGEAGDPAWVERFAQQLSGVPVKVVVDPSAHYLSHPRRSPHRITLQLQYTLARLLASADASNTLVWAHNLGVGRNLILSRELAQACAKREVPLVAHHHDWWFDNRWARWREVRRFGVRTLSATAQAVFPRRGNVLHAAINQADSAILGRHFGNGAVWLPNLTDPAPSPKGERVRAARRWLDRHLGHRGAVVWLLPCRTLRRKNIAEALLLARWLRPDAWLVVTGAASSVDELPYFRALQDAARDSGWRLRLGVLAGQESQQPTVAELFAASEAALLTSIQEGFGLPYLEAAAAGRPLIARRVPSIAPDLRQFGFRFPQAYDEVRIAPGLFAWAAERARQRERFKSWRSSLPKAVRARVSEPSFLSTDLPQAIPFSRLTLTAQLEVLGRPACESWDSCAALNPFLERWRQRAAQDGLRCSPWPRTAERWLSGEAYARRFFRALTHRMACPPPPARPAAVQADLLTQKLHPQNLFPILWSKHP